MLDRLHSVSYEVEASVFTKRTIQRAFFNSGLWPFDPDRMVRLAKDNVGQMKKIEKAKHTGAMTKVVEHVFAKKLERKKTKGAQCYVTENELYDPDNLVAFSENRDLLAVERKNARKRKREEEKQEIAAKRLKSTCFEDGCNRYSRSKGEGKEWLKCVKCGAIFCKVHGSSLPLYAKACFSASLEPTIIENAQ